MAEGYTTMSNGFKDFHHYNRSGMGRASSTDKQRPNDAKNVSVLTSSIIGRLYESEAVNRPLL
jgi:hypothetical protein